MRTKMTDYGKKFDHFVEIVRTLRSENGCPWDREQSPASLIRYLQEETGEAVEAITGNDHFHIRDELGDLLYLVILLSTIYEEKKSFHIGDVIESITRKMIRRHPHVFSHEKIETVAELRKRWQEIKNLEELPSSDPKKN